MIATTEIPSGFQVDPQLYKQALNEICKGCGKERKRNGSKYGEICSRKHKGLPIPEAIKPFKRKEKYENNSSSKVK